MNSASTLAPAPDASVFRPGGDPYVKIPKTVLYRELKEIIPKAELQATVNAAYRVMACLDEKAHEGKLDETLTDQVIAEEVGISPRSVQRALHALEVVLAKVGKQIITRMRAHGRRIISFVRGLAKGRSFSPPGTPLNTSTSKKQNTEETTTTRASSSSSDFMPPKTGEPSSIVPTGMVERAKALVPEATEERVIAAVAKYGPDWVRKALDVIDKRNRKPGARPVRSWGFVVRTLENWKNEGGPPPDPPAPAIVPEAKDGESAKDQPPHRLTAEEVAELVERCQSRKPVVARLARLELMSGLGDGSIPSDLASTIPADLMDAVKPRAP